MTSKAYLHLFLGLCCAKDAPLPFSCRYPLNFIDRHDKIQKNRFHHPLALNLLLASTITTLPKPKPMIEDTKGLLNPVARF